MANVITLGRLFLIPIFVWLALVYSECVFLVAAVFALAALTDWLDGFVARKLNQITEFGKVFDPLVDRLLVLSALIIVYINGAIPGWAVVVLLIREAVIVGGYQLLKSKREKVSVSLLGKIATATLFVSFVVLLLRVGEGIWIFYLGLLLYVASGADYVFKGSKRLLEQA